MSGEDSPAQLQLQRTAGRIRAGGISTRRRLRGCPWLRWKIWLLNEAESEAGGVLSVRRRVLIERLHGGTTRRQVEESPRTE